MKEYRTITQIAGPSSLSRRQSQWATASSFNIVTADGTVKRGEVLDTSDEIVVVQVFETTAGIGRDSGVRFTGETIKMQWGRIYSAVFSLAAANRSMAARRSCRKAARDHRCGHQSLRPASPRTSSRRVYRR